MVPTVKVVLGSIAFAIFWVLAVFPAVPFMPIGRIAGSLLGATLMVIFRVITPDEAYEAINLQILGLLFGTMVVSVYLERADMFVYLGKLLSWKSKGAKDLLCRICVISAIFSALFTNDTSCVVLTEFVLKIAQEQKLPPHPFLLALASSANIGSSATPIGNPQNLVIAVMSKISFRNFLFGIFPAMLAGVFVNALILLCMYWKLLSVHKDEENDTGGLSRLSNFQDRNSGRESINIYHSSNPSGLTNPRETNRNRGTLIESDNNRVETLGNSGNPTESEIHEVKSSQPKNWKRILWKTCVYLVTIGMLVALLLGLNMSWTAITAALTLILLDFKDAEPCLEKVSYSLLIFFCGMFITVDGFNKIEIPYNLWKSLEPHAKIDHIKGMIVLTTVIIVLSNLVSNVPTVLLIGAKVATSGAAMSRANEKKAWLILAWVSTVAGNLSLLGSAANLIVCEQARRTQYGYNLKFWSHLKFGVPSTIIVTAIGLVLIRG